MIDTILSFIKNPNTWIAVIPIVISIIAIFQTSIQTKLSNKHQLFDRRLEKYLLIQELLSLYSQNRSLVVNNDSICDKVDFPFALLANSSMLESMCLVMSNPDDHDDRYAFLTKCEMLNKSATETELIWKRNGKIFAQFIRQYTELLKTMFKQQLCIKRLKKESPVDLEEFKSQTRQQAEEFGLYSAIDALESTYNTITTNKMDQKLIKSIKL